MARYEAVVESPMSPGEAFTYMADLRNFEEWDPGVKSAEQVVGDGPGPGAEYDLKLALMTLRYATTEYTEPQHVKVEAHSKLLSSLDTIEITETGDGSSVRYDAVIQLHGPLKLLDPLFGLVFNRIGDKAARGMTDVLRGTKVA